MPSAEEIVAGLDAIARSWQLLAIVWHIYFGALVAALVLGFRPSRRVFGILLVPPLLSVSALAWLAANPFNGSAFAVAALILLVLASRLGAGKIRVAPWPFALAGGLLFAFGWLYPHFVDSPSVWRYFYAAPLGLVPCPTLSAVVGLTMMFRGLESPGWSNVLGLLGILYGVFGAMVLGVTIDWTLAVGSICALVVPHASDADGRS